MEQLGLNSNLIIELVRGDGLIEIPGLVKSCNEDYSIT